MHADCSEQIGRAEIILLCILLTFQESDSELDCNACYKNCCETIWKSVLEINKSKEINFLCSRQM